MILASKSSVILETIICLFDKSLLKALEQQIVAQAVKIISHNSGMYLIEKVILTNCFNNNNNSDIHENKDTEIFKSANKEITLEEMTFHSKRLSKNTDSQHARAVMRSLISEICLHFNDFCSSKNGCHTVKLLINKLQESASGVRLLNTLLVGIPDDSIIKTLTSKTCQKIIPSLLCFPIFTNKIYEYTKLKSKENNRKELQNSVLYHLICDIKKPKILSLIIDGLEKNKQSRFASNIILIKNEFKDDFDQKTKSSIEEILIMHANEDKKKDKNSDKNLKKTKEENSNYSSASFSFTDYNEDEDNVKVEEKVNSKILEFSDKQVKNKLFNKKTLISCSIKKDELKSNSNSKNQEQVMPKENSMSSTNNNNNNNINNSNNKKESPFNTYLTIVENTKNKNTKKDKKDKVKKVSINNKLTLNEAVKQEIKSKDTEKKKLQTGSSTTKFNNNLSNFNNNFNNNYNFLFDNLVPICNYPQIPVTSNIYNTKINPVYSSQDVTSTPFSSMNSSSFVNPFYGNMVNFIEPTISIPITRLNVVPNIPNVNYMPNYNQNNLYSQYNQMNQYSAYHPYQYNIISCDNNIKTNCNIAPINAVNQVGQLQYHQYLDNTKVESKLKVLQEPVKINNKVSIDKTSTK